MKKLFIAVMILTLMVSPTIFGTESGKKMFIEFQGNLVFPADSGFKDIYGSSAFYIRGKSGYKIISDFYLFFGCGILSKTGITPVLGLDAKSKQKICVFGIGYEGSISKKTSYRIEAGGANFSYDEEALNESVGGSKLGLSLSGSIVYDFSNTFFATFSLGYIGASDTIESVGIKLGGIHTSIGAGIRL